MQDVGPSGITGSPGSSAMVNRAKEKREASPVEIDDVESSSDLESRSKGKFPTLWQRFCRDRKVMLFCILTAWAAMWFVKQMIQKPKVEASNVIQEAKNAAPVPNATNDCKWRPEPLQGVCDNTKSTEYSKGYKTAEECENACCAAPNCMSFQFRKKEGCQWGGDTRLGNEGDGPTAWCEPRPHDKWRGQWVAKDGTRVEGACTDIGWNPDELQGQCFGLGGKRAIPNHTPEACRDACCADSECAIWEWRADAGCFYNKNGFACQDTSPLDFEPFHGKRKVVAGRTYTPSAYSGDYADMAEQQR
jgi:PAN domain